MSAPDGSIVVVGAGAVGSWVGAVLQRAGENVTFVARGAHGAAMRAHGLRVDDARDGSFDVRARVATDLASVDAADLLLVCVKGHQLAPIAEDLARLQRGGAELVAMQNGIPWWYLAAHPRAGPPLASVDPGGALLRLLDPGRTLGCVLYVSCTVRRPGVVLHEANNRFTFGRPDGICDDRARATNDRFARAGLRATLVPDVRRHVWEKLLGNLTFNAASALTRATMGEMLADDALVAFLRAAMEEMLAIARALGDEPATSVDARIAATPRDGFKTSMLQDVQAGRPLEIGALTSAVVELADRCDVPAPTVRAIAALARVLDASLARERRFAQR